MQTATEQEYLNTITPPAQRTFVASGDTVIRNFDISFSDIPAEGEKRQFTIVGSNGAQFKLEVKDNATGFYYNFTTNAFQADKASLESVIGITYYTGYIHFPNTVTTDAVNGAVSSGAKVVMDTAVANKMAVGDRVTGNAALDAAVITVAALNPDGDNANEFALSSAIVIADDELLSFSGDDQYDIYLYALPGTEHDNYNEVRFGDGTIDLNSSHGSNSLMMQKVIYQYAKVLLTISGYSPNGLITFTNTAKTLSIDRGNNVLTPFSFSFTSQVTAAFRILKQPSAMDILSFVTPTVGAAPELLPGENQYPSVTGTDTVNGAVTSGTSVTMDTAVASTMKVGDRITGNTALNAATVTVVSLDSTNVFTMSEAIALADELSLSFSNQMNYQWPVDSVLGISEGMIVVPGSIVATNTTIKNYEDSITIFQNTKKQEKIIKNKKLSITTKSQKPTIVKGLTTVQTGSIIFNQPQLLTLAGNSLKIGGYGEEQIFNIHGWDIRFRDLAITLEAPTTTTTEATSAHAVIAVADREGVINNVSRVRGIGIDASAQNPLITSGGGADGAGDWTMDTTQTLENGITLTIENTGRIATITGSLEVLKAGTSSPTLRFDIEKLVSTSA